MPSPVLQATGLVKRYPAREGTRTAVDGVSLTVEAGEVVGLLGPNGAGKSTTIGMLAGLLRPDAGSVRVAGEEDPTRPSVRRGLGCAPQSLALYGRLTAAENLALFGRLYGLRGAALRERVDHGLELAGLTERRRERVSRYSGGMQRRLNLACALVHDPPLLLLDEPTAGVDPQSRERIFATVEALRDQGRAVLYTTHYMEEAERLCSRVAIIDGGQVLADDRVDALVAAHGGPPVTVTRGADLGTVFLELTGRDLRE